LPRYLWFHAFSRDNLADTLEVLRHGPRHHPDPTVRTRLNEQELGIAPPCVYAYLGRTLETFGTSALSLPADQIVGTVSPFDSGGLVEHIAPLNTWQTEPRREYLARYSWSTDGLANLLQIYPTDAPALVAAYLRGTQPAVSGPHELWPDPEGAEEAPLIATIWADNEDCRVWLWETRVSEHLAINGNLLRWLCSSATYSAILRYTETIQDVNEAAWIESLLERFVVGGVSALVQDLRAYQEAAA
jgi:hypothetical protein